MLGRNAALSLAELEAVFGAKNVRAIITKDIYIDFAYLDHPNPAELMNRLGGTIKICRIQETLPDKTRVNDVILQTLTDAHSSQDHSKLVYAINTYPIQRSNEIFLNKLLKKIKPLLKSQKIASRYINQGNKNPHTAAVLENNLVERGTEINLFFLENKIFVGQTIGLQNINSYSFRDYERPARDDKSGMLPPKLAQMLINLALPFLDKNKSATIYDPFCGSGTILQEACLMGYNTMGSDISAQAVSDSEKNMQWFDKNVAKADSGKVLELQQADITKINEKQKKLCQKASAIVCEGYLGPAMTQQPTAEEIQKIQQSLLPLYRQAIENISQNIKSGTPVVLALPVHYHRHKASFLPQIPDLFRKFGLEHHQYCRSQSQFTTVRKTLIYKRPQQHVGREIWVLIKK